MFNRIQCGYAGSSDWKRCEEKRVVASEERLRELEEKYEGYTVYDNRGEKIGKVDDVFIDEADREEYIGVKMGFLGRKSTLIPVDIARVNEADRAIEVSESKDHVKDAPSFDDDEDITPEYEGRIRSHFGLESQDPSRTRGSYGAYSGARDEERESSAGTTAGGTSGEESAGDRGMSETPVTRQTEETGTFEEGGRAKVRRRIIREEVIEEDPDDRSS
jgi:sporulation protein YlmC with PRC-barrel domain